MEKYEQMMIVGEGSYGCVMKCRHRDTGQIVAIKKFLDTEEEITARRMAMREIRMLKKLRHENLVCLIEVFRVRKRFHLVFEFVDRTVLDELEENGGDGLDEQSCRERILQVIRAVRYCHLKHIIHRDVKPENVLVSRQGVVKLCDFGFARLLANVGEPCTEYVATRWYRAPELLVADVHYGPAVDVWAIGCLYSEMKTGKPLFPGDSDIDQLYRICNILGHPCYRHLQLLQRNPTFKGIPKVSTDETNRALSKLFPDWSQSAIDFLEISMRMDPTLRATTEELMRHNYLNHDRFVERFLPKLRQKVLQEYHENPLIRKYQADILAASDDRRQDLYQERYAKKVEVPRWKINLQDPFIKRKTSYVSFSSFKTQEDSKSDLKSNGAKLGTTLFKLEQRKQLEKDSKENTDRPSSDIELHLKSPSPPLFQSLQADRFTQHILHPTINNLCFTKETKRVPQPNSNRPKVVTKSPQPNPPPPRDHYLKRLQGRGLVLDVNQLSESGNIPGLLSNLNKTPPCWLNTAGYTMYKKNNQVEQTTWTKLDGSGPMERGDKTQFPNINTGSPYKKKKMPQFMPLSNDPVNTHSNQKIGTKLAKKRKLDRISKI